MFTWFWWGNLSQGDHCGVPDVDGIIILRWMMCRDVHRVLVWKPEGKRPLRSPRRRWKDNIKIDDGQRYSQVSGGET
jgi:hypothetical protein